MAKKIQVELEAKTDKAIKEIKDVKGEIQNLTKSTEDGFKDVGTATKSVSKGIKGIGTALKAAGIGLAVAAFAKLTEILNQNQKAADFFNTSFEVISIAFNDFVNFLVNNVGAVTGFFKSVFDDPLQSIKDLGNAIKNNIIERFNSLLDTLGFAGQAIVKFFEGDFAGAAESAKSASKEFVDVLTGVDGTVDKVGESVTKVAKATTEYTKSIIEQGKQIVETNKKADKSAVVNQLLIEQFDRQAELQRQIRDDESKTIDERIAANEELGRILEKQEKLQKEALQTRVDAAQLQFDKLKNDENEIALLEAKNELAAVEATITGLRSEQLTNLNALERERKDLVLENAEAEIEAEQRKLDAKKKVVDQAIALFGAETAAGKAALIAKQLLNAQELISEARKTVTFSSLVAARSSAAVAEGTAQTAKIGFPQNIPMLVGYALQAVGIIGAITQAVGKSKSVAGGLGGGSAPSITPASPRGAAQSQSVPPAFNIVGASGTNQLAEAIGGQAQQPVKAYVVSNDVTTAQELDRNIVEGASLG